MPSVYNETAPQLGELVTVDVTRTVTEAGTESFYNPASEETFDSIEEALEAELRYTNTSTYPAAPVSVIDLREPISLSADFFYNYYTKDERTATPGNYTTVNLDSLDQDVEFIKKKSSSPRSNILKIRVPSPPRDDKSFVANFAKGAGSSFIRNMQDKIIREGAIANTRFSNIFLHDNQVDETFYKELSESVAFDEEYKKSSTDGALANKLAQMFPSPTAQASASPSTIKKVLSNYQPQGVAYAPTDSRESTIAEALRDVRFVKFSFTVNNAVVKNLVHGALEDRGNIYQDELLGIAEQAEELQRHYVATANPGNVDSSEFEMSLDSVYILKFPPSSYASSLDEASYPIGIIIDKSEITQDPGESSFTQRKMDPIVLDTYGDFNIFDSQIKYGATYLYSARIIYMTGYEATAVDPNGTTEDERVYAISMISSSAINTQVAALENIAPPPPQNLRFNYNFMHNSLDIFWEEPTNSQRDVVRYQVFRRRSIDEPFVLLAELNFDESTSKVVPLETAPEDKHFKVRGARKIFRDVDFERDGVYIYALAAVDARGLTSSYSEQIRVSFNRYANKIERESVSPPFAPKPYPNLYLSTDLFVDTMQSSAASRMRIFFDPEYYDVLRSTTELVPNSDKPGSGYQSVTVTNSENLLAETYKIQIINLDLQNSEIFTIKLANETGPPLDVPMTKATLKTLY